MAVNIPSDMECVGLGEIVIAGDGYAYVPYAYRGLGITTLGHLRLLRISTSGGYDDLRVADITSEYSEVFSVPTYMIANNDMGILLSWIAWNGNDQPVVGMAVTNGTTINLINMPEIPGQSGACNPMVGVSKNTRTIEKP